MIDQLLCAGLAFAPFAGYLRALPVGELRGLLVGLDVGRRVAVGGCFRIGVHGNDYARRLVALALFLRFKFFGVGGQDRRGDVDAGVGLDVGQVGAGHGVDRGGLPGLGNRADAVFVAGEARAGLCPGADQRPLGAAGQLSDGIGGVAGVGRQGGLADGVVHGFGGQGAGALREFVVAVMRQAHLVGQQGDDAARRESFAGDVGGGHEADDGVLFRVGRAGQVDGVADGRSPSAAIISSWCSSA